MKRGLLNFVTIVALLLIQVMGGAAQAGGDHKRHGPGYSGGHYKGHDDHYSGDRGHGRKRGGYGYGHRDND